MIYQKAEQGGARYHLGLAGVRTLPVEWEVVELGSLLQAERGISVGVMYPGKHDPNGIALIKAGDINNNVLNRTPEFRITSDKHREYQRTELVGGELLITLVGALGQCVIVPFDMEVCNAARAIAVVRLKELEDVGFVRACLLSRPLQHIMQVWANTTVQPTINLKEIKKLPLPWPPEDERKAITEVLGAFDDKIELNRQMNATLEEMARAIFKSWFVDFDPVHAKASGEQPYGMDAETAALFPDRFEVVNGREVPAGWCVSTLGNEIELAYGKSLTAKNRVPGQYPVYGSNGPVGSHNEKLVDGPGIVVGRKGNPGTVNWSEKSFFPIDTTFYVALNNPDHSLLFWFFALELQNLPSLSADSAVPGLNRNIAYMNPVVLPSRNLMERFEETVQPMFAKIEVNSKESDTLAKLRDTLLPRLISGRIRITGSNE